MIYRLFGLGTPPARPNSTAPASPLKGAPAPPDVAGRLDALARSRDAAGVTASDTVSLIAREAAAYQKKLGPAEWREAAVQQAWRDITVVSGAMGSSPLPALALMLRKAERAAKRVNGDTATVVRRQALQDFELASRSLRPGAVSPTRAKAIENWREVFAETLHAAPRAGDAKLMARAMQVLYAGVFQPQRLVETRSTPGLEVFMSKSLSLPAGQSGMYPVHVARIATQSFKKAFTSWPMGEPGQGLHMVGRLLDEKKEPVLACVRWQHGPHCLPIERVENGRVFYRNPLAGPASILPPGSGQEMLGDGHESLPSREFEQRLQSLVFPR